MNSRFVLLAVGALALFAPGCCHLHGCGSGCHSGCGCGFLGCLVTKIRDKFHCCGKCGKHYDCCGYDSCGIDCCGGAMVGSYVGDCGCGGTITAGCGCGAGAAPGGHYEPSPYVTPPMNVPATAPPPPFPSGSMQMPPPIPPADSSSTQSIPQGVQQVSVEEFQRLPGVVISGPGSQTPTPSPAMSAPPAATPQMASQPTNSSSMTMVVPPPAAQPIQQTSGVTSAPSNARQVQQTGWAPVRK